MENIRKQFPILRQYIYANTPVFGPMYEDLMDWRQERDLDLLIHATEMPKKRGHILADTRTTIAKMFNCNLSNVALINNFSTGMNFLLEGLDKSSKILVLESDYPSVNLPFERRRFKMFYAKIDENVEANITEILEAQSIDVLAFAAVNWQNGIKVDFEFIKQLKLKYPNLLIITDATQFIGTQEFSFEDSGIDVLATSGYKWLLGGYGNGFMLFSDFATEKIAVKSIGDNTGTAKITKQSKVAFAKYFEPGHLSDHSFGSLLFSLNFLHKVGLSRIATQINSLSKKAMNVFGAMDLLEPSVVNRKSHSTIFNIKGDHDLFIYLTENGVMCAQRGNGIRLGFHFYNTKEEIDQIAKLIKDR